MESSVHSSPFVVGASDIIALLTVICIRIFKTREEAQLAKKILEEGGISATISEDKFNDVPIQKFGVSARFRLKVENEDLNRAALFLANKLRKTKKSKV